jgi:hypothetical protein
MFIRDLDENHRTHYFKTKSEFENRYFKIREEKPEGEEGDEEHSEDGVELEMLATIDLVVFGLNSIKDFQRSEWISHAKSQIREFGLVPETGRTHFVLMKWEDDGVNKVNLLEKDLADLFFLPLDRSLTLQKLEIIFKLPSVAKPSYLFVQKTDLIVHLAKRSMAERINDVGLAIRNPVPLRKGLLGHFFLDINPAKDADPLEIFAKVQFCEPHPEYTNEYLVYFYYFGITKKQLTEIRGFLSRNANYRPLLKEDKDDFVFNPDNLFYTDDEKRIKNVIVIDTDEGGLEEQVSKLNENMDQLRIVGETSYYSFYQKYLSDNVSEKPDFPQDISEVSATSASDMGVDPLAFFVDPESFEVTSAPELPSIDLEMMGHSLVQMMDLNKTWLNTLFPSDFERTPMEEAIIAAKMGREIEKTMFVRNAQGEFKAIGVHLSKGIGEPDVRVELRSTTNEAVRTKLLREVPLDAIDAIVIDHATVPQNASGWAENLHELIRSKNLIARGQKLKIFITVSTQDRIMHQRFKSEYIMGVFYRPLDLKSFMATFSMQINNSFSMYGFENLGWLDTRISLQLAKDTRLKEISEFGATIYTLKPIAPGTFLFLRGEIFDNAPRKNLCARFYLSEEHEDGYNNYLMYFGINEDFMIFARNWFREVYAASKSENS